MIKTIFIWWFIIAKSQIKLLLLTVLLKNSVYFKKSSNMNNIKDEFF